MRIYKHSVSSAIGLSKTPTASSTNRVSVAAVVCQKIVSCFGVPTVGFDTVLAIVRKVIWDDVGHNFQILLAEIIALTGVFGTLATLGMPVFLVSGALNALLVVPSTSRLFLMLAADITLILERAFKNTTDRCMRQPQKKDIETAAHDYRALSYQVHKRVKKMVPKSNVIKSFQFMKLKIGFEKLIADFKYKRTEASEADLKDVGPENSDSEETAIEEQEMEDWKVDE